MTEIVSAEPRGRSVTADMAERYGMRPEPFEAVVRSTCMKPDRDGKVPTREEFAAFLLVAKEYSLNPLTKEIYAFPAKGGGIQPIVSIDGWMRMINNHPAFDGMDFEDILDDENRLVSVTCKIYRKDRTRPTSVIEYMAECQRATDVWKTWPRRMLRHKAAIQCARYAFSFSGIADQDEWERMNEVRVPQRSTVVERLNRGNTAGFSDTLKIDHHQIEVEATGAGAGGGSSPTVQDGYTGGGHGTGIKGHGVDKTASATTVEAAIANQTLEDVTVIEELRADLANGGDLAQIEYLEGAYNESLDYETDAVKALAKQMFVNAKASLVEA